MTTSGRRVALSAAVLFLGSAGLAGCGSASEPSPPGGVDGLVIPTPDPEVADFVAEVDNPWFPLLPGTRWVYDDDVTTPATQVVVEAVPGPEVAGIATTTRVWTDVDGTSTRDHFAQDLDGNVWWFGREGEWAAGTSGAEAGLVMPARPRAGDGFRLAFAPGLTRSTATVEEVGGTIEVPLASYDDTVELAVTDGSLLREDVYARGVGLVRTDATGLVAFDEPR
ncbi:hypothetical protein ASE01_08345 [Nocardioides sp. Root190]|uniref:hypothetical protein n=1 Tax=Nocardioides sp. Root190 TaxID=1736488 RepID=UPI0006FA23D6|nr:hypothetical protein [Nocardioides sp. Root190]KRB78153.1 hypothetical protein ASE01_08345 [Nocardioides sp. Root190]